METLSANEEEKKDLFSQAVELQHQQEAKDYGSLFIDACDLDNLPTQKFLIEGVLYEDSLTILSGRDESFKSLVAVDWALSIATGTNWQKRTTAQGKVLYVAGEGARGIAKRKRAWETYKETFVQPGTFTVMQTAPNMFSMDAKARYMMDYIETQGFTVVVFDTLRRISGPARSNTDDMGQVIDNIERVKRLLNNGTVITVAHSDKGNNDTRGFSGIEDDVDVVWRSIRNGLAKNFELKNSKMKDFGESEKFDLAVEPMGESIVVGEPRRRDVAAQLASNEQIVVDALYAMHDPSGLPYRLIEEKTGLSNTSVRETLKKLRDKGLVINTKGSSGPGGGRPTARVMLAQEAMKDLRVEGNLFSSRAGRVTDPLGRVQE